MGHQPIDQIWGVISDAKIQGVIVMFFYCCAGVSKQSLCQIRDSVQNKMLLNCQMFNIYSGHTFLICHGPLRTAALTLNFDPWMRRNIGTWPSQQFMPLYGGSEEFSIEYICRYM